MGCVKCLQFALPLSLTSHSDEFKELGDTVRQTRCFQMPFNVSIQQLLKPNNVIFSQAWRLRSELKTESQNKTGKVVESLLLWCHKLQWVALLHCKKNKNKAEVSSVQRGRIVLNHTGQIHWSLRNAYVPSPFDSHDKSTKKSSGTFLARIYQQNCLIFENYIWRF